MSEDRKYILDQSTAGRKLQRMALEIVEQNAGETEIILAGIAENGVVLAAHLARLISESSSIHTHQLTITLDKRQPGNILMSKTPELDDKVIIVVDDVANSGKTMLYALKSSRVSCSPPP